MIRTLFTSLCVFASLIGVADAQVTNGKVTTAAPAYTNGNISPLSLDTSGNLRTSGAVTGTVTANAYGKATTAAPSYSNNTDNPLSLDLAGNLRASILTAIPAGTAIIGKVGIDQTTPGTTNGVQVNAALPAGTAIIGKIGIDQTTPGTTNGVQVNAALPAGSNNIGNVTIAPVATTAASASLSTAASVFKASAGTLYSMSFRTASASLVVQVYDNASACSGTIRFAAALESTTSLGVYTISPPIAFSSGITSCTSTGTVAVGYVYQ